MFDEANRLAAYTTGGNTTTFSYDADGARVIRDEGSTETVYIAGIYEQAGSNSKSYYTFGGSVVAFREQDTGVDERYYLVSDHLGTNSHQIKYSDGTRTSQYYLPFGGDRGGTAGNFNTDRGYTGQVSDAAHTGLLFYNARYYDPTLRRFISADTIIPDPGNPQDLNRYTYVRNNPVRYSDPSGHCPYGTDPQCQGGPSSGSGNTGTGTPVGGAGGNGVGAANCSGSLNHPSTPTITAGACTGGIGLIEAGARQGFVLGALRIFVFDDTACTEGSGVRCSAEILLALPGGKLLRLFKYTDEVGDAVGVVLHLGDDVAEGAGDIARTGDELLGVLCSFSADTEVVMADGSTKPISEIAVGDWVLAQDPETGERGPRQVTHLWIHDDVLVDLGIDGHSVTTTEDHPFWNHTDQQWQRADTLDPGDLVLTATGDTIPVDGIDWTTIHIGAAYNLTIEDIHSYHVTVGDEAVLVHNIRCDELGGLAAHFDRDELAQFAYQHAGEGDFVSTPTIDQIAAALATDGVRLADQNAVRFTLGDTVVIVNEDLPWRSTAYVRGGN